MRHSRPPYHGSWPARRGSSTIPSSPRRPLRLAVALGLIAVLLLSAGLTLWMVVAQPNAALLSGASIGGPFTLTDTAGRTVTERNFRGKFMLIYFGYTSCPDVCPTTLNQVAVALDRLGPKADRLQALFVTVDPRRDTPEVMRQYTAAFTPRLLGLTGTPEQIAAAAKAYRVYYAEHRTGSGPLDYTMDHSSILYLMGPDGQFVEPVRADADGAEMAAAIAKAMG